MKSVVPKQFLALSGQPVLMHTIQAFHSYSSQVAIFLVLPQDQIASWHSLCQTHNFKVPCQVVPGGSTRFQSVKKGLDAIEATTGIVAVHDGVRPLVPQHIIGASYHLAAQHGSAVAAVRLKESIRITDKDKTHAVDRSQYRLIQTPQTFKLEWLKDAYNTEEISSFTDDASVVENAGYSISLFEGSHANIKITTPEDMPIAEALLKREEQ